MDLDLSGKLALVTGSTMGIGHATALGLARMGAGVIVNGRTEASVAEAIDKIKRAVPKAELQAAPVDLSTAEGCAKLIRQVPAVDILVNSMGIYEPKPFFDIPDADWQRMFEVNVMSGVRLTRHYLKGMLDADKWGRVVFVSSESAIFVPKEMVHYGFSKSAQLYHRPRRRRADQGHQGHRQLRAAGPDLGRVAADAACRPRQGHGHDGGRARQAHVHRAPARLAAAALCEPGGDRQPYLLRLLQGLERHQRRGPARRRRHRHQPVLSVLSSRCLSPGSISRPALAPMDGWIPVTSAGMTAIGRPRALDKPRAASTCRSA